MQRAQSGLPTLPEDLVCDLVDLTQPENAASWFRARLTLSLLCRAARHQFDEHWAVGGERWRHLAPRMAQLYLGDCEENHVSALASTTALQANGLNAAPLLRVAALRPAYCDALTEMSEPLRQLVDYVARQRYSPVGNKWYSRLNARHGDYKPIRRHLRSIYKYKAQRTDCDALQLQLALVAYARESRVCPDVVVRRATPSQSLNTLYVYVLPPHETALTASGHDLRGMVPLPEALRRGPLPQGAVLYCIKYHRAAGGADMATYWAQRVQRMTLLRRPIKLMARTLRRRARKERKAHKRQ